MNTAGDAKHYFPEILDEDSAVILTKKNHVISFAPVRKEMAQETLENIENKEPAKEVSNDVEGVEADNKSGHITGGEKQSSSEKQSRTAQDLTIQEKSVKKDNLTYSDGKTISYQYTSLKNGVKEEIILSEKPETNIFEFRLDLPGMKMEMLEGSKEIRITDKKTKKLIAYISEPNIQDADGKLTYDEVHYETEKGRNGEYILKVVVDEEYLGSEDTKYPVTIDPTVWWTSDRLESACVSNLQYSLNVNRKNTTTVRIHNNGIIMYPNTEDACYIDTSGIDKNNAMVGSTGTFYGSDIKEACLSITETGNTYNVGSSGVGTFTSGSVEVKTPTSTWAPDTITWNNHPPMGDQVWSQFKCKGIADTKHKVDLKDWAQAVADRSIENTGLALKCVEEGTGAQFYSSSFQNQHYMSLTIIYEDPHIGEKDIYTYEDFSTPNGSGKIELSQGNFLYRQDDVALPTPQLGLEISRTYNSRNTEQSDFGTGWTCGYDARILKDSQSTTYIDETGAIYKLYNKDGTIYACDENPDLSLEIKSSTETRVISATEIKPSSTVSFTSQYIITDKANIKRYFDADGKLCLIEEANGTFIYIKYHSTFGLIQSIHSSKGQKIDFEFSYSGGDYFISRTTLADGSSFNYTYTGKRLTKVTHRGAHGNEIVYNYEYNSNGQMSKIIDAMGTAYRIEYDGKSVSSAIYPDNSRIDVYTNYEPLKTRVYTKNPNNMVLHYEEYEFDVDGKVLKTTKDAGNVSTYLYDGSLVTNTTEEVQYHELQNNIVRTITPTGGEGDKHLEEEIEYNDRSNVSIETDEEGNVTTYTYGDPANPDLETKVIEKNAEGETISETAYEYDSKGNLIKEIDYIEKTVTKYTYDNDGNATESTETLVDKNTNLSNISTADMSKGLENSKDTATYYQDGNTKTSSVLSGTLNQTEQNTYDELGRIETTTDEKNIVSSYAYDEFGRVKSTTTTIPDKTPETTMTVYDANGRVKEETDKLGRKTTYQYDSMGRVISKTLTYGNESRTTTTAYGYEDNFYVITGTGANKRLPTVAVVTEKNADGEVISKTYTDPYGQTVREESNGIRTDYTYDKQGNVFTTYTRGVGSTNPATPKLVVTVYDKHGRLTDTIQNPVYRNGAFTVDATYSIVTSNKYDENGNLTEETDGKGNKTTYEYNEEGDLTKVSLPDGSGSANDTLYAYDIQNKDASGNIISTTDKTTNALGNISETVKNGAGQVLSVEDKNGTDGIKTSYEYDASGNKIKETFSNGSYVTYEYNKKNLLTEKYEYNTNKTWTGLTSYSYNEDDLLQKVIDYNVTGHTPKPYRYTIYKYDALGRMTGCSEINKASDPEGDEIDENKLVYKYDIEDKLTEIRYPNASGDKLKGIEFEYNGYKWLVKIKGIINENGTEVIRDIRGYEYYNDSKVKTIKDYRGFLNGGSGHIQKSYEYDRFDRVTKMSYADSSNLNTVLEQYTYGYDRNSNIISETIINNYPAKQEEKVNETRTYMYDSLNRMVTSKITDNISQTVSNASYTYDKAGNCTKMVEDEVTTESTYNSLNQLVKKEVSKNGARVGLTMYNY
ncbi:MAG: RHS repeat protein, partial [Eubacterium sp.]|nr:RHS repeat protein [Eubacterium sp.]